MMLREPWRYRWRSKRARRAKSVWQIPLSEAVQDASARMHSLERSMPPACSPRHLHSPGARLLFIRNRVGLSFDAPFLSVSAAL